MIGTAFCLLPNLYSFKIILLRLKCKRCSNGRETTEPPITADTNSDLSLWYHSERDWRKIPDQTLRQISKFNCISFLFHQKSHDSIRETSSSPKPMNDEEVEEVNEIDEDIINLN